MQGCPWVVPTHSSPGGANGSEQEGRLCGMDTDQWEWKPGLSGKRGFFCVDWQEVQGS